MFTRILRIDQKTENRIARFRKPRLNRVMVFVTRSASGGLVWWIVLVIPFLISAAYRAVGINLIAALGLTALLGELIIKRLTSRERPSNKLDENELMIKKPCDYSFPSGHTASSFTVFAVTLLSCPAWISVCVFLYASLIGFSRIYVRVHYFSDVLAGALLGLVSGSLFTVLFQNTILPLVFAR